MSFRNPRLHRSELAVPGSNVRMPEKAADLGADIVILDLEDAVAPDEKEQGRINIIEALDDLDWSRCSRARANARPPTPSRVGSPTYPRRHVSDLECDPRTCGAWICGDRRYTMALLWTGCGTDHLRG
jgi:HpcH/HpaI aldolase/citrate lyase family protein